MTDPVENNLIENNPVIGQAPAREEPKTIDFLRHGQGEHQFDGGHSILDPCLTADGRDQASSWTKKMGIVGGRYDLILVSPLKRCIETALFAFGETRKPGGKKDRTLSRFVLCRHARERYWHDSEGNLSAPNHWDPEDNLEQFLTDLASREDAPLPRALEILHLNAADRGCLPGTGSVAEVRMEEGAPKDEASSVEALREELLARPEKRIAVVCHAGVMKYFCGFTSAQPDLENCELIQTEVKDGRIVPAGTAHAELTGAKPPLFTACRRRAPGGKRTR